MSIKVKARAGESVDQMIRRLRKAIEREGLVREMKRKEYYEKPSEVRRRKERQSARKYAKNLSRIPQVVERLK